jgi:hypothetical protein
MYPFNPTISVAGRNRATRAVIIHALTRSDATRRRQWTFADFGAAHINGRRAREIECVCVCVCVYTRLIKSRVMILHPSLLSMSTIRGLADAA